MPWHEVTCPNPACPGREVEPNGEALSRETWQAFTTLPTRNAPAEWGPSIHCPQCSLEGVDVDDEKRIADEEEALGRRCEECGIVTANPDGACPHCGERFPEQTL